MELQYTHNQEGRLRIVFSNDDHFVALRNLLMDDYSGKEEDLLQSPDQIWVDLDVNGGKKVTLHWDAFAGLMLMARDAESEQFLQEFGARCEQID